MLAFGVLIVAFVGITFLSVSTLLNNPKSATNRLFFLFSLSLAAYLAANYQINQQFTDAGALFWVRMVMTSAIIIVYLFNLLANTFPTPNLDYKKWSFWAVTLSALAMLPVSLLDYVWVSIKAQGGGSTPGIGMPFFIGFTILLLGGGFVSLAKKYKSTSGVENKQVRLFLFGSLIMFTLILTMNLFFIIIFNNDSLIDLLPLYILAFVGVVSYAIVRFGLFDIRVIATEAITVVLWIVLFSKIFTAVDQQEALLDGGVFIIILVFGLLLIKSVRKEVEQRRELQLLTEKLKELDARKDEFLSVAAHELRAPMTAIKGYLSMVIEGDTGKLDKKTDEYIRLAVDGNERLVRLVNNMLNVSRIEEGRLTFDMGEVELSNVVKVVFKEHEEEAKAKNLKYTLEIPPEISDKVYVDKDRIHEVVGNFVSNAIKYTDSGMVALKLSNPERASIRFEIMDTGAGLTEDELGKLFHKFYRAESNIGKAMGTGLGLYITKLLVEKFGGKLGVVSEKNKGSTFWFELPAR